MLPLGTYIFVIAGIILGCLIGISVLWAGWLNMSRSEKIYSILLFCALAVTIVAKLI